MSHGAEPSERQPPGNAGTLRMEAAEHFCLENAFGVERSGAPPRCPPFSGVAAIHLRRISPASGGNPAGRTQGSGRQILSTAKRSGTPHNIEYKIFNVMWCQPLHFEPFRNMLRRDRTPPRKGSERPPSQGTAASLPEAALKNAGTAHAAGSERARRAKQLRADMPTAISRI